MTNWALEIDRSNISRAELIQTERRALVDDEARLTINRFALTANNITYAAFGDVMRYWDFFPSSRDGKGQLPVWGFADVTESRCPDIPVGDRVYGYFPAASELVTKPEKVSKAGFVDASDHRAHLPPAYNRYIRCAGDAGYDPAREAEQMVLQPLYLTGWLLARFLREEHAFGTGRVYLTSASSKTAIGMAKSLNNDPVSGVEICALTSAVSREFVNGLGIYEDIQIYSDIGDLPTDMSAMVVDFAGDAEVNRALHTHFGDELKANIRVGGAHWQQSAPAQGLPGPKPVFFFAPDHFEQARETLGAGGFQAAYGRDWLEFAASAHQWLTFRQFDGATACLEIYRKLIDGDAIARDGLTITV
ncbi:MAG: hypothetical protein DHS20C06_05130 [Hyphobacterium sp.]|nr:MAG: hypothetical protein DHS20C06_05130 [Hyphobacterium sp.]